jgi:hypothetical protein
MRTASDSVGSGSNVDGDAASTPTTHDLLNEATMWLQYSRGVTATLADLIHEADEVDYKRLGLSLEAIAAMTLLGARRLSEAHAQVCWDTGHRLP